MSQLRRLVLLVTLLALVAFAAAPFAAAAPDDQRVEFVLTVLHNNDGESSLLPAEIDGDLYGGIALFGALLEDLRRSALTGPPLHPRAKRGVLTVSSGDNFLAGPQFQASLDNGPPFYDAIGMSLIGYDAIAMGNHEFDFGPDVLADFIESFGSRTTGTSRVPFLSANLIFDAEPRLAALVDKGIIAGSTMVRVRGERVGVVGATTPFLASISSPRNVEVLQDVAGAVQSEIDDLEASGVNKIVFISHLQNLNEDLALLAELQGVDIAVAGGGDELLANPGDLLLPGDVAAFPYPLTAVASDGANVPVVTTAGAYGYVGNLVVGFDSSGNVVEIFEESGPVRVAAVDGITPDPDLVAQVEKPVADFVADLAAEVVAETEVPLDSRRGLGSFVGGAFVVSTPGERVSETNLGNIAADSLLWQAQQLAAAFGVPEADIALQNGGGIRSPDVILKPDATPANPEPLTRLEINQQWPFANFVSVVEDVSATSLKGILETAVSDASLVGVNSGAFAQISGFTFEWDSTFPEGQRVRNAQLDDGTPLVVNGVPTDAVVTAATIDFLARGGNDYDFGGGAFTTLGVTYEQGARNFMQNALGGLISIVDYPFGGEGRITQAG
ncbi:MAG: 5'-nucleotidase C-terminal domain-containing protein [Acidimicrobiia bacterium]